jgi:hypothetical protein
MPRRAQNLEEAMRRTGKLCSTMLDTRGPELIIDRSLGNENVTYDEGAPEPIRLKGGGLHCCPVPVTAAKRFRNSLEETLLHTTCLRVLCLLAIRFNRSKSQTLVAPACSLCGENDVAYFSLIHIAAARWGCML